MPAVERTATRGTALSGIAVFLVAVVAMLPALRGGFLAGDDRQLVLNSALVNRPSLGHALELLTLKPHRDLYQPVPLLSFAADFAVVRVLGLGSPTEGPEAAAWFFHLTNLLIHAINALLVWRLIIRLHEDRRVAFVAAVLFAAHPLAVEPTAWLNGRMILLSTLFCLAALNAFDAWHTRPRLLPAVLGIVFVVLAMASKVQVGLPVLMALLLVTRRTRPRPAWWILLAACALITVGFAALDVWLTSRLNVLAAAGESLEGSRLARTLLALGWYFQRFVLPVGLASFHPAAPVVTWGHSGMIVAGVTVAAVLVAVGVSLRWSGIGAIALVWFLATVATTLPLLPSRNVMVAERYVYLPNVALFWAVAAAAVFVYARLAARGGGVRWAMRAIGVGCVVGFGAMSWHVASFYRDSVAGIMRIIDLYPDTPGLRTRLAWEYHRQGRYSEAIDAARRELAKNPQVRPGRAHQVIGLCRAQLGDEVEAIRSLQASVRAEPNDATARYRLGQVYERAGNVEEAMTNYRLALERQPGHPGACIALGNLLRTAGRTDEAANLYERVLAGNPYDSVAILSLAEIEMTAGRAADARVRLRRLVDWMPENWAAWTNLGLCCQDAGQAEEAILAYRKALAINPQATTALTNLVNLLMQTGRAAEATVCLDRFLGASADRASLWAASELLVSQGRWPRALQLWTDALKREPGAPDLEAAYAWTCVLGMQWDAAGPHAAAAMKSNSEPAAAVGRMTMAMLALAGGDPVPAVMWANTPPDPSLPAYLDLRRFMRQALSVYGEARMDEPWPYYVVARLLHDEGDIAVAAVAMQRFNELCSGNRGCMEQAGKLGVAVSAPAPSAPGAAPQAEVPRVDTGASR